MSSPSGWRPRRRGWASSRAIWAASSLRSRRWRTRAAATIRAVVAGGARTGSVSTRTTHHARRYAFAPASHSSYAVPLLTGRRLHDAKSATFAFWASNIGMIAMTAAFAVAGISQVVLERRMGLDFVTVQKEIEIHFWGLILAATLFIIGITAFVWNFIRHGKPRGEVRGRDGADVDAPAAPDDTSAAIS